MLRRGDPKRRSCSSQQFLSVPLRLRVKCSCSCSSPRFRVRCSCSSAVCGSAVEHGPASTTPRGPIATAVKRRPDGPRGDIVARRARRQYSRRACRPKRRPRAPYGATETRPASKSPACRHAYRQPSTAPPPISMAAVCSSLPSGVPLPSPLMKPTLTRPPKPAPARADPKVTAPRCTPDICSPRIKLVLAREPIVAPTTAPTSVDPAILAYVPELGAEVLE